MARPKKILSLSFSHPLALSWGVFTLLAVSFYSLSYFSMGPTAKVGVFLFGILLPIAAYARFLGKPGPGEKLPTQMESLPALPTWGWAALLLGALAVRLWRIDSLFLWPTGDEGLIGSGALGLSQNWNWRFFYTVGQNPPAFVWLCSLFFKLFHSALFDLWAPAALVSFLAVLAGVAATRRYFPPSFTLVFAALLAFSYWPLYTGRRCLPAVSVPLGELFLLFLLACFLKAPEKDKNRWAFLSGLGLGLQSFTYVAWPVVALTGGVLFLKGTFSLKKGKARVAGSFAAGALLALLPFLYAVSHESYGQHISNLTAWSGWFHDHNPLLNGFTYLKALFLDLSPDVGAPAQGGLLNPLVASFFLLGCVELGRFWKSGLTRCVLLAFLLFLAPGVLSLNLQTFRVIQLLPLVLGTAALGSLRLLRALPANGKVWIPLVLLAGSGFWDLQRLALPYSDVERHPEWFLSTEKSMARYRAYEILKDQKKREGSGFILGEWDISSDRTLNTATFFSNAVYQDADSRQKTTWLAIVADNHYMPFLKKRFPGSEWIDLNGDIAATGNRMLGIIPLTPENQPPLLRWVQANSAFLDLNWAIDHLYDKDCLSWMNRKIQEDYPLIQGDPFLESAFWEKTAYFYYYYGHHFPENLRALELAVQRGYPAAHLYAELMGLYRISGQTQAAQKAMDRLKDSEDRFPWR